MGDSSGVPTLRPDVEARGVCGSEGDRDSSEGGAMCTGSGKSELRFLFRRGSHGKAPVPCPRCRSGLFGPERCHDDSDCLPRGKFESEAPCWLAVADSDSSCEGVTARLAASMRSSSIGSFDLPNVPNRLFLFSAFLLASIEGLADWGSKATGPLPCFCRVKGKNLDLFLSMTGPNAASSDRAISASVVVGAVTIRVGAGIRSSAPSDTLSR